LWLREGPRRRALARRAKIARLVARRGAHWVGVKARGRALDEARRAALEERFAIRTAQDAARELGQMKGVMMKAGQMLSFVAEGLPEEAKAALASLQSDAPPMAPSLAEQVIEAELGAPPERLFLAWDPTPVAAASIGQVHKATLRDGRDVAVKVQYPGIGEVINSDLDNAELLYAVFSALALKSLDVRGIVDELRERMGDELDYRIEAASQAEFAARYDGHPFIRVPKVIPHCSGERVLTSEWMDGATWAEFEAQATPAARQAAAEALFRFEQGSIYRHRVFNGDPHPGNYRFAADGSVTFLDFGLVKRWTKAETDVLWPLIDPLIDGDAERTTELMVAAGFLRRDHGLDPQQVWTYVSRPYQPYLVEEFTFTREYVAEALGAILDVHGPYRPVIERLNLPSSFVILDRVVWGVSALMGRLEARNRWRAILAEYRKDAPPATTQGELELAWRRRTGRG
ncbi:MAG: ABC1 kinase family protein, partial [Acidimicrobiales bacterium]